MPTPDSWPTRVNDVLMEAHVRFRAHALSDGPMDESEAAIDAAFVTSQQIVNDVQEELLAFCHIVRVGRRSPWHDRKQRERTRMYGELQTA